MDDFMYTTMKINDTAQQVPDLFCAADCVPKELKRAVRNVSKADMLSALAS